MIREELYTRARTRSIYRGALASVRIGDGPPSPPQSSQPPHGATFRRSTGAGPCPPSLSSSRPALGALSYNSNYFSDLPRVQEPQLFSCGRVPFQLLKQWSVLHFKSVVGFSSELCRVSSQSCVEVQLQSFEGFQPEFCTVPSQSCRGFYLRAWEGFASELGIGFLLICGRFYLRPGEGSTS